MGKDRVEKGPSVADRAQFVPKNSEIFPKIPMKITEFPSTPDFGNLERKFRKENFGKEKS
jgi:hypothetical protein